MITEKQSNFLNPYFNLWLSNAKAILILAFVNVGLTAITEVISRLLLSAVFHSTHSNKILVFSDLNTTMINKQIVISILMTFFATILGGGIYYFRKRMNRFLFFVLFGILNSILAQCFAFAFLKYSLIGFGARLVFDAFYSGLIRFPMFELFRSKIVIANKRWMKILKLRAQQDMLTTMLRVIIFNLIGISSR